MAQFGDGDIIPKLDRKALVNMLKKAEKQVFSGEVVLSLEDAVKLMNSNANDMDTWVVRPTYSGEWKYAYEDMQVRKAAEIPWKICKPRTLAAINNLIYSTKSAGKPYSHMSNNCQHFALEMFDKC